MRAIVLSGGGARGAYQMGVWKALKKLKIKYDIVTGTSIGALNGMMMVQNNYYKCSRMWKTIDFNKIYDDFNTDEKMYKEYLDKIISGGIDTSKIRKIINDNYKKEKLYNSKIKFGVVTYNMTEKKTFYATKANTNPDKLKDYILASATCFPFFKPTKIGQDKYIDGGFSDYLPINLALELNADEIIAVDLEAPGIKQKVKDENVKITYIQPSNKLDSFLKFDKICISRMITLGYNDTMKVFNKLEGKTYTFKKGTINKIYKKHKNKINNLAKKNKIKIEKIDSLEQMNHIVEQTLSILKIDITKIYDYIELKKVLKEEIGKIENIKIDSYSDIKKIFNKAIIVKHIYTKLENNDKINSNLFYKELITAIFIRAFTR